jgi:hypothetical protein
VVFGLEVGNTVPPPALVDQRYEATLPSGSVAVEVNATVPLGTTVEFPDMVHVGARLVVFMVLVHVALPPLGSVTRRVMVCEPIVLGAVQVVTELFVGEHTPLPQPVQA